MELYRFRSCDKLLGKYKELEEQYFYFAPPSAHNDPMEGKIEFYWQGDKIAWFGLLKDYVWQLFLLFPMLYICDTVKDLKKLPLQKSKHSLQKTPILNSRAILKKNTENAPTFQMFTDTIIKANKKIMEKDIQLFLTLLHPVALAIVLQELSNQKIFNIDSQKTSIICNSNNQIIEEQIYTYLTQKNALLEGAIQWDSFMQQINLFINWNMVDENKQIALEKRSFFQYEYPIWYVQKSQQELCLSNWSLVCFNTAIKNPATWAYYAEAHKGVGLIFDTNTDFCFNFNEYKNVKLDITKVDYNKEIISRNFFESIGQVAGAEIFHWFCMNGQISSVWTKILTNIDEWRKKYWDDQKYSLSRKGKSWKHEEEYRILHSDSSNTLIEDIDRKFYYQFNILKGVVFGVRTHIEDKKQIIDILNRKCKENNRKNFPVYQAQYDKSGNFIKKVLLMTLPFNS